MRHLVVIIFLLAAIKGHAQNLTLTDLFTICSKPNWSEVNDFMIKKGWEYYESTEGDHEHYNTIVWAFEKSAYSEKAVGWFYLYTVEDTPQKIRYEFFTKKGYSLIQGQLASAGIKQSGSSIKDDYVQTDYTNLKYTVSVRLSKREKGEDYSDEVTMTAYSVQVIKKASVYDDFNGPKKEYYENGSLKQEYMLVNGLANGVINAYYENGKLKWSSVFVNDKRNGLSKQFDEDGNLVSEFNYVNGVQHGAYKIFKNKQLRQIGSMKNGQYDGLTVDYDSLGNVVKEFYMKEGLLYGPHKQMYYDGTIKVAEILGQYDADKENGKWTVTKFLKKGGTDLLQSRIYVNGIKHGPFKEVRGDSIMFGSYYNDKLDGLCKIHRNLITTLGGEPTGDTTGWPITFMGSFKAGLKEGKWQHFGVHGNLVREGSFVGGLEEGEWKYYFEKITDKASKQETEFSKKLFLIESYKRGKLHGKSIRLAHQVEYKVPCAEGDLILDDAQDSCSRYRYAKMHRIATYVNDVLEGPFEERDSVGNIIAQGLYRNGLREGHWIEYYLSKDWEPQKFYWRYEGEYKANKEEGKWTEHRGTVLSAEINFHQGERSGKCVNYNWGGGQITEDLYDRGRLIRLSIYDSATRMIQRSYDVKKETSDLANFVSIAYQKGVRKFLQEYSLQKNSTELLDPRSLHESLLTGAFKNGRFEKYDSAGQIIEEGVKIRTNDIGLWRFYAYHLNVFMEKDLGGEGTEDDAIEHFYFIDSKQPYSGTIVVKYDNGQPHYETKVKNGLKDGKAKTFDEAGKVVKTEKFEKGILQL